MAQACAYDRAQIPNYDAHPVLKSPNDAGPDDAGPDDAGPDDAGPDDASIEAPRPDAAPDGSEAAEEDACPSGFSRDRDGACVDVNECETDPYPCDPLRECSNTKGGFECGSCRTGYELEGDACVDVNECETDPYPCDPLRECSNTEGGFECGSCPKGYELEGDACEDVNECETDPHACDPLRKCTNTEGGFECGHCPGGYELEGDACADVNECKIDPHACAPRRKCTNTEGGFQCGPCPGGYELEGDACVDVNECDDDPIPCPKHTRCVNDVGGYDCVCADGYEENLSGLCIDVDECTASEPCDPLARCENTDGSFSCTCPRYYESPDQGLSCVDEHYRWHAPVPATTIQAIPDYAGNVFVAATLTGLAEFAGSSFESAGQGDLLVAKFDANRKLAWVRQLGGTGDEATVYLAVDPSGDLVMVGFTGGGFDMGAGLLNTGGAQSRFVAKFRNSDGGCLWSLLTPNAVVDTPEIDWWNTVAVDSSGNVLVSGRVYTFIDVGSTRLSSVGGSDIYVFKLSPMGTVLWAESWGGAGDDASHGVGVDADGNVLLLGDFDQGLSIGSDTLTPHGQGAAVLLAKLDPDGKPIWSKQTGGSGWDLPGRLAVDPSGDMLVTGMFWSSTTIGTEQLVAADEYDAYVTKVDPQGNVAWVRHFAGTGTEYGWGATADADGNLLVSGAFDGTVDFGDGPRSSAGSWDAFVVKLDADGKHLWSQRFGGPGWDTSAFLATDPSLKVYVSGVFTPPVDFGGGAERSGTGYVLELAP